MTDWETLKENEKYDIRMIEEYPYVEIRNKKNPNKILKFCSDKKGYNRLTIRGIKEENHRIHRLVAIQYIPNPENKSTVNHKNGIKTDNRIENLEWNTQGENIRHAFSNGLNVNKKGKLHNSFKGCIDMYKDDIFLKRFEGKTALKEYGFDDSKVYKCVKGKAKHYKGYTFKRVDSF